MSYFRESRRIDAQAAVNVHAQFRNRVLAGHGHLE
jgi:hypothetical protein